MTTTDTQMRRLTMARPGRRAHPRGGRLHEDHGRHGGDAHQFPDLHRSKSAVDALTAAAQNLNDDTVTITFDTTGMTSQGKLDPKADKATMTMKLTAQGKSTRRTRC